MSCLSEALGPVTDESYLAVTLAGRLPVVRARRSEDPAKAPRAVSQAPLELCEIQGWPFLGGEPQLWNVLCSRSGVVQFRGWAATFL